MKNEAMFKESIDWERIRFLIKIGIIGAVLNLAGDLIAGWGVRDMRLGGIEGMVSPYLTMSDERMFWAAMLGLVGAPVSTVGHVGIYKLLKPYSQKYARLYQAGILGILMLGGAGVHMSSLAAAFFYKYMMAASPETALVASIKFVCYFSLPLYLAFFVFWVMSVSVHIRALAGGFSPYPRWCWVFSMPVGTLLVVPVSFFGNHAIVNAVMVGALTLGNLWMLGGHLLMLDTAKKRHLLTS